MENGATHFQARFVLDSWNQFLALWQDLGSEPVFVKVSGAHASIPRNRFRQPV
jgi:hypothetical protein